MITHQQRYDSWVQRQDHPTWELWAVPRDHFRQRDAEAALVRARPTTQADVDAIIDAMHGADPKAAGTTYADATALFHALGQAIDDERFAIATHRAPDHESGMVITAMVFETDDAPGEDQWQVRVYRDGSEQAPRAAADRNAAASCARECFGHRLAATLPDHAEAIRTGMLERKEHAGGDDHESGDEGGAKAGTAKGRPATAMGQDYGTRTSPTPPTCSA